ncbi:MAG: hypothetical protein ABSB70_22535 [Candidatus Velthaea sp.]
MLRKVLDEFAAEATPRMRDRRRSDATNVGVSVLFETLWKDYHCGPITVSTDGSGVTLRFDTHTFEDYSLEAALVKTVDHLARLERSDEEPSGAD